MRPLYVAATGQHVGKTTSTLGLITGILEKGYDVGYCKPVGQKHILVNGQTVDKDVILFAEMLQFDVDATIHSPVVMGRGFTKRFIDDPSAHDLHGDIIRSAETLNKSHKLVVHEGTGHPGVGSVANVSNADVAKLLNAGVVMVAEGGIGNTIDRLSLSLAKFNEYDVPILGVIINKVIPDKLDQVQYYVGKKLKEWNLDLLGVVPFDKRLSFPIMETVKKAIKGRVMHNANKLNNRVEDIIAGSLVDVKEFTTFQNILLVVSSKRLDEAIKKIKSIAKMKKLDKSPISGLIITGDKLENETYHISDVHNSYIQEHQIPVVATHLDTFGSVVKISRIEVKINTRTPWKTRRAIELIQKNVDLDTILNKLEMYKV